MLLIWAGPSEDHPCCLHAFIMIMKCSWQVHLWVSKHDCTSYLTEWKAILHLLNPHVSSGVLPQAIYLPYHILNFYVISHYALLIPKKKKKVDIHKENRDKKYVLNLIIVGPNHGEKNK